MKPQKPTGLATNLGLLCMTTKARRGAGTSLPQINTEDTLRKGYYNIWSQPESKAQTCTSHSSTVSLPENLVFIFYECKEKS